MKKAIIIAMCVACSVLSAGAVFAGDWVPSGADMSYTGGNIGVGTTTPTSPLHINGGVIGTGLSGYSTRWSFTGSQNGMTAGLVSPNYPYLQGYRNASGTESAEPLLLNPFGGNVGIGTTAPAAPLHIIGSVGTGISGYSTRWSFSASQNGMTAGLVSYLPYLQGYRNDGAESGTNLLLNPFGGNVGIGTKTPQSALAVNGTITAKEVVVTLTGWADHVFNSDYKLMSLNELEKSIKTDRHLPGIPSADEVKKNGVSIGDMQAKLLQKVEELTLHVIEQNKKLENLKTENETLKKQMAGLQQNVKR